MINRDEDKRDFEDIEHEYKKSPAIEYGTKCGEYADSYEVFDRIFNSMFGSAKYER